MKGLLGKWKSEKIVRVAAGMSLFTLGEGEEVRIEQIDKEGRKVLVRFSENCIDWAHKNFLNDFVKVS